MKSNRDSQSAFSKPRLLISLALGSGAAVLALAQPGGPTAPAPGLGIAAKAEVVRFSAAASHDKDLRELPYIAPNEESEKVRRLRHPLPQTPSTQPSDPVKPVTKAAAVSPAIPNPSTSFDGVNSVQSGCACLPPDTDGDVGPNHYIQSVNTSIKIFDKSGNPLNGTNGTTYNSFFSPLGSSTPCGNGQNDGDGFVFYDQIADRWVVSDFAFPSNQSVNYQCIGVSKTNDPVSGGWWLYALQIDPNNPTWIGDYPKFGLWPDAYYLSVNLFDQNSNFQGVRVFALPRAAMINGTGAPNPGAVSFAITPATLGDAYSLVPATFRTGSAPPAGTPEYFMAINSSSTAGTVENQVFAWRFHVDFANLANSTFGVGASHAPNGTTTVNGFVDAFTSNSTLIVPQTGTTATLDTLGDKLMTPLVYQNLGGTESLWASHTINNNQGGTGPTEIRWYQFNVTGGSIPATPAQQQTFSNGGDGLWRWMPSIAVDGQGNMTINYSVSSSSTNPAIKYAGRLSTDPTNTLGQGEALLIQGGGHQTDNSGRWGDYSMISIDPSDNATFWLTNEYYASTSSRGWSTRIGKFKFVNAPSPVADTASITADDCNSNGKIDPNETVTVNLAIRNAGTIATSNLVATLQSSSDVTNPSASQTYGAIAPGATITKSFTFTAGNVTCGSIISAVLQLQDGATNFGTVSYSFTTGITNVVFSEGFDGVTPPTLPAGWSATNATGAAPLWVTSSTTPDGGVNDAFVDDPATVSDKRLDTPGIAINSTTAQVSFRHNYSLEDTFDGAVLEISSPNINGGAFTDITNAAVGGSFVTGGYDTTISASFSSPIGGRSAWTGSSSGYITTIANLGPNVVGQTIKLRFRMASDSSNSETGWRVDTVKVISGSVCCGGPAEISAAPPAVLSAESYTPANNAPDPGEIVTVNLSVTNNGGSSTTNLIGTLQSSGGVTNPSSPQSYGAVGAGATVSRPFTFVVNGACGSNLTLSLSLQDGFTNLGTVTYNMVIGATTQSTTSFSNPASVTIPGSGSGSPGGAPASLYPSNIAVSGLTGTVSNITVTLTGLNHTFPSDVDMLLVSPTGQTFIILSDVIGSSDWNNITYTLDDSAGSLIPSSGTPVSGTFKPTNYSGSDAFPAPAPQVTYNSPATAGSATFGSVFNGINPNGTWSLYIVDDLAADTGSLTGGWALTITTSAALCSSGAPVFTAGPPPSPVIVGTPYSFVFTAGGNPAPVFSLTAGSLPPGLMLSPDGKLSGTATSGGSGSYTGITVAASNGIAPNATQTFTLTTATRASNYIASFGLAGSDAVLTNDYDNDGLTNLMEYGLGLDPTTPDLSGLPVVTLKDYSGTEYLSMTFHRSSLASDLTYTVQVSGDLVSWTDVGSSTGGGTTTGAGFVQETGPPPNFTVEVRDIVPYDPNNATSRFMRLKISTP